MVGSIKRRTGRGKTIRRRNTVSILEGEENRKKEVRIIVAVLTDSNDVVSWLILCELVVWGVLSDAKCNCLFKRLAAGYILFLAFCDNIRLVWGLRSKCVLCLIARHSKSMSPLLRNDAEMMF